MTPAQIIKKALSEHAGVTAIVGTRISPMGLELGADPYITYQAIGCGPAYLQEGPQDMQDPGMQIDAWVSLSKANWHAILESLGEEILSCLYGSDSPSARSYFQVTGTGTDMIEQESRKARRMFEVTIWHDALQ